MIEANTEIQPYYGAPVILNYGPSGSGKTTAIKTLCDCEQFERIYVIATEAQTLSRLSRIDPDRLAISYIAPMSNGAALLKRIKTITKVSWEDIKNPTDKDKAMQDQLLQLLVATVENFIDDRTRKEYGPISELGLNNVLVLDNLTGLGGMSLAAICGLAVIRSQPQFYAAMQTEINALNFLINGTKAWKVILAHADIYRDPLNGKPSTTVSALGQKNAQIVQAMFGDIILSKVTVTGSKANYFWANLEEGTIAKPGVLGPGINYTQDYKHIVKAFYG